MKKRKRIKVFKHVTLGKGIGTPFDEDIYRIYLLKNSTVKEKEGFREQ
jgi:hypothetical protein